jgi:hypothetical protein
MRLLLVSLLSATGAFAQFSFGVKGGAPFTDFLSLAANPPATLSSNATHFIIGPSVELRFPAGIGVELDALYRRLDLRAADSLGILTNSAQNAWEFPLLMKYRAPGIVVRPFVEAGAAFNRWSGIKQIANLSGLTKSSQPVTGAGVVLGGGLEIHPPLVRISGEIRFTRWGAKDLSGLGGLLRFNQNQAEFLIGISF